MSQEIHLISLDKIKNDTSIQCRVSIDEDNIADIMAGIDDSPPIRLYREELPGEVWYHIGDGWHRKIAHERAGRLVLRAYVFEGGLEAALLYAVKANGPKEHGVKRTNADKKKAITVYMTFKDWYKRSDHVIAMACNVAHKNVGARRLALELAGTIPVTTEREGADGVMQPAHKGMVGISPPSSEVQPEILPPEEKASEAKPSLLIKGRLGGTGPDLFDDAVAQVRARQEPSVEYVPYGSGEMLATQSEPSPAQAEATPSSQSSPLEAKPTATQAEVANSVEASFAKAGPLDPKTLLPVAPKIVGVESSTPTNGRKPGYQHYNTPKWLLDLIRKVNPIALDPCSNQWSIVGAEISFDVHQDGLACDWASLSKDAGLVYVNPPYSDVTPWAERAIEYAKQGAEVVLCLPTSHSTAWYKLLRKGCQAFCQLGRKVDFGEEGIFAATAKHETTLFYFGAQRVLYREVFESDGHWVSEEGCAHYHAPRTPEERQPGLPETVTPQEEDPFAKVYNDRIQKVETTPCAGCGGKLEAGHYFGVNDEKQEICGGCAAKNEAEEKASRKKAKKEEETFPCWRCAEIHPRRKNEYGYQSCVGCGAMPLQSYDIVCMDCKSKFVSKQAKAQHECEAKKEVEPPPRLHAALKACAKGYQQEGYEVRISTPRQKGQAASSKSVMGYLGGVADRDVIQHSAVRDEQEDAYEILFSVAPGKALCTLHAVKKDPIKSPLLKDHPCAECGAGLPVNKYFGLNKQFGAEVCGDCAEKIEDAKRPSAPKKKPARKGVR